MDNPNLPEHARFDTRGRPARNVRLTLYGTGEPEEVMRFEPNARCIERSRSGSTAEAKGFDRYRVLAFDGEADATQAWGLVAQDRSDGYCGFWTNDAAIVADVVDVLVSGLNGRDYRPER